LTGQDIKYVFGCNGGDGHLRITTTRRTGDGVPSTINANFYCGTVSGHDNICSPLNYIYSKISSPNTGTNVNSLGLTLTP
jgi:hypothetical protein